MMHSRDYQPFILLGTARTGSTMLWSYLNSHPDILCLRGVYGSKNKVNFGEYHPVFEDEVLSPELIQFRNSEPVQFLSEFVFRDFEEPYRAVGFKFFYDHVRHLQRKKELMVHFSKSLNYKVIHLKRINLLESLFSYKRALAQDNWHSISSAYKTDIPIEECETYFESIRSHQSMYDMMFGNRAIDVTYEDLLSKPQITLEKIQMHLGIDPEILVAKTKPNPPVNLSDSILNYEELIIHFQNTDYQRFFPTTDTN